MSMPDLIRKPDVRNSVNPNTRFNVPPSCYMPSFTYLNHNGKYRFTSNRTPTAGFLNAFDLQARIDTNNYASVNCNATYGMQGIIGRSYQPGLRVKFLCVRQL